MSTYVEGTLPNATPVPITADQWGSKFPATVAVRPAVGDTVRVEYRAGPTDPTWTAWDNGDVTAASTMTIQSPISALRITRQAGTGTTSYYCVMGGQ